MKNTKTKKILAAVLSVVIVCSLVAVLASCGGNKNKGNDTDDTTNAPVVSDLEYVKQKGTLVVGITDFAPMDYQDADGNWIGFDADMAKAFAESLGVTVEFQEIEWGNKIIELNNKTIDCVWNGMTLGEEVLAGMECSKPYCNNAQVIVIPADKASEYNSIEACKDLTFAVEEGSAGEDQAAAYEFNATAVLAQADALNEVNGKTCDAAIIDSLMAAAMVGEGTGYENLTYINEGLNSEEYGVGFRKGSELANELNSFFAASYADGSFQKTAETYGVQAAIVAFD